MTPEQLAINAAQDARLVANAIASGPTEAILKAAEAGAKRLADALPDLMQEIALRRIAAREATKRSRRDQRIIQRDAVRLAARKEPDTFAVSAGSPGQPLLLRGGDGE